MFKVYQDGKSADTDGYPNTHVSWSKETNTHSTFRQAVAHAIHWAWPISKEGAEGSVPQMLDAFKLGPVNLSLGEAPMMMEIREDI